LNVCIHFGCQHTLWMSTSRISIFWMSTF
jgi:hypothetical protein